MNERIKLEMGLIKKSYPNAEWLSNNDGGWVRILSYRLPNGIWDKGRVDLCFEVKNGYPAVAPYSFYVKGGIKLKNGETPQSYTITEETPFGGQWGKFSWHHTESWKPTGDLVSGSNLSNFISSFIQRLSEAT